ncbi:MAG: T9SS type A sorting domain-containing protein [Elusimicrobia bacterium]|nr:T9SS type A sorting domain-containing protein [Elusimicrobiota bacterium]
MRGIRIQSGEFGEMAYFNGKLYVEVDSYPSENISKVELHCYNTTTRLLEKNWNLYEGDWDSYPSVYSIKATTGRVYFGGEFTSLKGQPHNNIAALDTASGNILDSWSAGTDGVVQDIVVTNNAVFAGGRFGEANNVERLAVAAFSPQNGSLLTWNPRLGPGSSPQVYTMGLIESTLYIGGPFYKVEDQEVNGLAGVNINTGELVPMDNGNCGYVNNIGVGESSVYFGSSRECEVQGQTRYSYGALNTNGSLSPWAPSGSSHTREIVPGSQAVFLVVDSGFLGGIKRDGFAVFDINTGQLEDYSPVMRGNSLLLDGNTLYVGDWRHFSAIDLVTKSVRALPEENGYINAMVKKGDVIYLGGKFDSVGGEPRSNLAAINTKGELLSWAPQLQTVDYGNGVNSMVVSGDQIIVAGEFTSVNDKPRKNVAAIHIDGTLQDWAPVLDEQVRGLAVEGSSVYVVGDFGSVDIGGQLIKRSGFAEFVGSGLTLSNWDPGFTYDGWYPGQVQNVAAFNGILYVVGYFNQAGNITTNATAALRKSDGALVPWNADLGNNLWSSFIQVVDDRVYIGGDITTANGQIQGGLAVVGLASPALVPPVAPEKFVVAQRSSTTLSLQWDPSEGATSYGVKVMSPLTLVKENITTAFTPLDSLTPNTKYSVGVKACNAVGCSSYSMIDAMTLAPAPTELSTASVQATTVVLQFNPNGNPPGTTFVVQQVASLLGAFQTVKETTVSPVTVSSLLASTEYYFRVMVKYPDGSLGEPSAVLLVKTGVVLQLLKAQSDRVSQTEMGVSWSSVGSGWTYWLDVATNPANPPIPVKKLFLSEDLSATVGGLTPNMKYFAFVKGCQGDRCSDYVAVNPVITLAKSPRLQVERMGKGNATLRLLSDGNASGTEYTIEKWTETSGTYDLIYTGSSREIPVSGLFPGEENRFRVTVIDPDGGATGAVNEVIYTSNDFSVNDVFAYPVPFKAGSGADAITFDQMPDDATAKIYTTAGTLVKELRGGGEVVWNVRNDDGEPVSSGVYYVRVSGSGGDKTFKIVVQR